MYDGNVLNSCASENLSITIVMKCVIWKCLNDDKKHKARSVFKGITHFSYITENCGKFIQLFLTGVFKRWFT